MSSHNTPPFKNTASVYGGTAAFVKVGIGNRATKVNDGTSESYTCNAANMLTAMGANSYTNDLAGNTLTGGGRTNTWDSQNKLSQCVNGSTTTVNTYAADGLRHRSASTTSGVTTTRDSVLDASMFVREQNPSAGMANVATYLVGPRGPEYRRDDSSGAIRWYCYDGLGCVLGEVNSSGTLTATRSYDVYGSVRTSAGTSTSKHKFCGSLGHPSEDETGLIYMRARYMDPVTGRFVSEDKSLTGVNWFAYCSSNPINKVDPTGLVGWDIIQLILTYLSNGLFSIPDMLRWTRAELAEKLREKAVQQIRSGLADEASAEELNALADICGRNGDDAGYARFKAAASGLGVEGARHMKRALELQAIAMWIEFGGNEPRGGGD